MLFRSGRFLLRFNGDSGANYSDTYTSGQGTTGYSGRDSGTGYSAISMGGIWNGTTTTTWATNITHIFNYTNTTTYKTTLSRDANDKNGSGTVEAVVGLYRATPASITSLTAIASGGNFSIGTVMSLYGIAAA